MFQRLLPLLLALAHLSLWVTAFMTLGKLDGPYPTHFDMAGKPNAWNEGDWWLLPLIALAISAFMLGSVLLARRLVVNNPQWVNMPRKADWVRLPVEGRLRAFKPAAALVFGFAVFINLMMVSLILDSYAVATGAAGGLSVTKLIIVLACLLVWLVLSFLRIRQAVGDEVRAARQAANQAAPPTAP